MKKNLLLLVALLATTSLFAQKNDSSKLRAGFGTVYDSGIKNVGYAFNGVYSVNRHWEAELSFTHIFKRKQLGNNVLDFNAHYVFVRPSDKLSVYGLAGMGFNFLRITDVDKDYYTDTRLGLNVGLGANYKIADKLSLAPLLCYTFSESGYTRLGVSIQYQF